MYWAKKILVSHDSLSPCSITDSVRCRNGLDHQRRPWLMLFILMTNMNWTEGIPTVMLGVCGQLVRV